MRIRHVFCATVLAIANLMLLGCASETTTTTTTEQTEKRTHTQEDLKKTGQSQTGPALEKTDAAITTTGPR
ncbi:MAG TPA: hypothetical protein VK581_05460 [Chthoniobacterales bacterium]|nr:hypothetical protein [Chthoniobacterales bacterium]